MNNANLDISGKTLLKISLVIIGFYILYSVKEILIWFIFALIISILFNPVIDFLQRRKVPRVFAVLSTYLGVLGVFTLLIYSIVPLFAYEIRQFLQAFPEYLVKISPVLQGIGFQAFQDSQSFLGAVGDALEKMSGSIFSVLFAIFGGVFSTLFVVTTAIFISLEEKSVEKALVLIFPQKYESYVLALWARCQKKVAGWFGARLIGCLFVGVISTIVFLLFNVEYPFTLGFFAAVFNFIPYVGPFLTGLLLFLLVFPAGIIKTIFVLVAFVLIQQIENYILSPLLMKRFVDLPPVLVLVSIVVGAKIWGFLGAILIIPIAGILFEFLKEFLQKRREKHKIAVVGE